MRNPFNIKKDISQIRETGMGVKGGLKKIEEKFPLFCSFVKSTFVVVKWFIVLWIIIMIIGVIYYVVELPYQNCLDECPRPPTLNLDAFSKLSKEERDQHFEENRLCRDECKEKYSK